MLFDLKQFELFFRENALKKGLSLFRKGALEAPEKTSRFGYLFSIHGQRLSLRKRGDQLLDYNCSCAQHEYCEHLGAALFYFQQDALGISSGTGRGHKPAKKRREALSLYKDPERSVTGIYYVRLRKLLDPFLQAGRLDQKAIDQLTHKLQDLIRKENLSFYLDQALIRAFLPVFQLRFSGHEQALLSLYHEALERAGNAFANGLLAEEKAQWHLSTLHSVSSNRNLYGRTFSFLIPRFLSWVRHPFELRELDTALEKRRLKPSYTEVFDPLRIARLSIALKTRELSGGQTPLPAPADEPELILSQAELCFCEARPGQAFRILATGFKLIRTQAPRVLQAYLDYVILNARQYKRPEVEMRALREKFIHTPFIHTGELDRFLQLLPGQEHVPETRKIVAKIRAIHPDYFSDKVSLLLLRAGLYDELVGDLKRQSGKFGMVHQAAMGLLPSLPDGMIAVYVKHLSEALGKEQSMNHQRLLFSSARPFIDRLPARHKEALLQELLSRLGRQSQLSRFILETYPLTEG